MFSFLYPWRTPEHLWLLVFSRGYKMETLARNGIKKCLIARLYFNLTVNFEDFTCIKMNLKSVTSGVH